MSTIHEKAEELPSPTPLLSEPYDPHPPLHPVLSNFDILTIVFQYFNAGPDSDEARTSKKHLFQAAQTCKSFLDPALDSLWMSMDTLLPLFKLLPALELLGTAYVLYGAISDQDMDRLNSYARRIKKFTLTLLPTTTPLLPTLQTLHAFSVTQLSTPNVAFVLSPTLERVNLENLTTDNEMIKPFLFALGQKANGVRSLSFRGEMSQESSRCIMQFNKLISLEICSTMDPGLFGHIGALPSLESLIYIVKHSPPLPSDFADVNFPKLKYLRINGSISTISSYFKHLAGGPIETMVITTSLLLKTPVPHAYWETLFSTISSHFTLSLRSLHLIGLGGPSWFLSLFPHLSTLPNLKCLRLQGQTFLSSQVSDLAHAVRGIHELHLPLDGMASNKNKLTLEALQVFAEICPSMTVLQIQVKRVVKISTSMETSLTSHGLHTLIIASDKTIDVDFAPQVASYIDQIFPCLQCLRCAQTDEGGKKFWKHVDQIVRVCQLARQHERIRAAGE